MKKSTLLLFILTLALIFLFFKWKSPDSSTNNNIDNPIKEDPPKEDNFPATSPTNLPPIEVLIETITSFSPSSSDRANNKIIRGIWVQADSIVSKDKIDQLLQDSKRAHINTIYAHVFPSGNTMFSSSYANFSDDIENDFDPLDYLIKEAKPRGIEIHAWFTIGYLGSSGNAKLVDRYPELKSLGPDGHPVDWINFIHPTYESFMNNLLSELLTNYDLDGIHFDYLRYPNSFTGFDDYTLELFSQKVDYDPKTLRYGQLPAYGFIEANPLISPTTAEVIASFSNGIPALTINTYYQGEVILINWDAEDRSIGYDSQIIMSSLNYLQALKGRLYIFSSAKNTSVYGNSSLNHAKEWLTSFGWTPKEIKAVDLTNLPTNSTLIMAKIYSISEQDARALKKFVALGGNLIVIDGPVNSINYQEIKEIIGMSEKGDYFKENVLITPISEHPLVFNNAPNLGYQTYVERNDQWLAFRRELINKYLESTYTKLKPQFPNVNFSITVIGDQEIARNTHLLDWESWLKGEFIDTVVPRAYVESPEQLTGSLSNWQPYIRKYPQIVVGLRTYKLNPGPKEPKNPDSLVYEIYQTMATGSSGFMLFDYENMNSQQLNLLGKLELDDYQENNGD